MDVDKCIMTCIPHYVILNSFIALKNPLCSASSALLFPPLIFLLSYFSFPRIYMVEITYYVAFLGQLLSLSNVHLFPPCLFVAW